jgi:hypothetical protein
LNRGAWLNRMVEERGWRAWLKSVVEERVWRAWLKSVVEVRGWRAWLRGVVEERGWGAWLKNVVEERGWGAWLRSMVMHFMSHYLNRWSFVVRAMCPKTATSGWHPGELCGGNTPTLDRYACANLKSVRANRKKSNLIGWLLFIFADLYCAGLRAVPSQCPGQVYHRSEKDNQRILWRGYYTIDVFGCIANHRDVRICANVFTMFRYLGPQEIHRLRKNSQ